jgi:hypothetical protein
MNMNNQTQKIINQINQHINKYQKYNPTTKKLEWTPTTYEEWTTIQTEIFDMAKTLGKITNEERIAIEKTWDKLWRNLPRTMKNGNIIYALNYNYPTGEN